MKTFCKYTEHLNLKNCIFIYQSFDIESGPTKISSLGFCKMMQELKDSYKAIWVGKPIQLTFFQPFIVISPIPSPGVFLHNSLNPTFLKYST